MPVATEFSTTPSVNVTIGGVDVGENCSPAGLNNAIRYMAAVIRDTYDRIGSAGTYMPTAGGSFTGDILRSTRGAYLHHAGAAQIAGQIYTLPEGSARPAAGEGVFVFYYT